VVDPEELMSAVAAETKAPGTQKLGREKERHDFIARGPHPTRHGTGPNGRAETQTHGARGDELAFC
jgi:hypothetical protein